VRAEVEPLTLRLRAPFRAAWGAIEARDLLLFRVGDDGVEGVGEAAPLEPYDGVPLDVCRAGLEVAAEVLARGGSREEALAAAGPAPARAAVDVALLDLAARRAGVPLWRHLGADAGGAVEVNATIAAEDRAGAHAQAAAARAAGFRCVKVKVGIGDDAGRVAAVRSALGPEPALRLDANGAWTLAEARAALRALAPSAVELCEEPVRGVPALRALRGDVPVLIAMDETAAAPGAAASGAADAVCLKVATCGGITPLLEQAEAARAAGTEVYLASTLDGPVGIAAALHAGAVVHPDRPSGLATLGLFAGLDDTFPPREALLWVPEGPGLGL
jgi:L-alanine-DL-glutamate epimerase-like enolase superfamily enzyme